MARWVATFLLGAALALACGGAPPTTAPTVPAATVVPVVPVATAEPAPDLSAVPAPDGLALTLRFARPRTTVDQVLSLLGATPFGALVPTHLDVDMLVEMAAGAPVASLLDLDQPVYFAVSDIASDASSAKAVGAAVLSSPVAAREALQKYFTLVPTAPGIVRLKPRDDAPAGSTPRPCEMALSPGGVTRLVCGLDEDSVRHLGPYVARTMPAVTSNADLRLEVFMRALLALDAAKRDQASVGDAWKDPAEEMVDALAKKLYGEMGSIVVEASSDGATADLKLTTSFEAAASPLARAFVGLGAPDTQPPAAYGRLPKDASFAWFSRGAQAADVAPLKEAVVAGLRQWLAEDGYSPAQIDDEVGPLQKIALTGGPWVIASGYRFDAARAALAAYVAGKPSLAARTRARAAMQGWFLAEVDEPPQTWIDVVRELVRIDARKPAGKTTRKSDPSKEKSTLSIAPVPAALKLPEGTLHVESRTVRNPAWTAAQAKKKAPPTDPSIPYTTHVFVVPDGAHTWFAAAEDPALAASEVRASLATAPGAPGPRATALDGTPRSEAGFVTIAALAMWIGGDGTDVELQKAHDSLEGLATLPSHGDETVPLAVIATPRSGGAVAGGDVTLRFVLSIALAASVAAASPSIF